MRDSGRYILIIAIAATAIAVSRGETAFSKMSVEQVSELLAQAPSGSSAHAASAMEAANANDSDIIPLPVELTAADMVTKIYGVIDPDVSKEECVSETRRTLRLSPEDDQDCLWLETDGGYGINYYGLVPDVSAMARFDEERLSDFCFFFLFPYTASDKRESISRQTDFCGTLLQEMTDIGIPMDLDTATDALFEAVGDHKGSFVDVRLLDEKGNGGDGRYILILSVEPGAFTPADYETAEL